MRDAGLGEDGWPRLAVVRADHRHAFFRKVRAGGGFFTGTRRFAFSWDLRGKGLFNSRKEDVALPVGTFDDGGDWAALTIRESVGRTAAPMIPPKLLPSAHPRNYYLLWEADSWDRVAPPRDPMLLARVNGSIFVVLATWEMTDLERTVLAGRIA